MRSILYTKVWSKFLYSSVFVLFLLWMGIQFFAYDLLRYNIYYWLILIARIFAVIVIISAIPLIIQVFVNTPHKDYETGGELEAWYEERVQKLGVEWCREFIESVSSLLESNVFTFLSPTANKGIFEKAMFWHIARSQRVKFFVSDLALIEHLDSDISVGNSICKFFSQEEAKNIFNVINEKVDVIYDIKGALWYTRKKEREKLIKLYYDNLLPSGILIFDGSKSSSIPWLVLCYLLTLLTQIIYFGGKFLGIKSVTRYEVSTAQKILFSQNVLLSYFKPLGSIVVSAKNNKQLLFSVYRKVME